MKKELFRNYAVEVDKGNIRGHIPLEHEFGFCKTFKKITKNLGFHLTFKLVDLQDTKFSTIATDINVTFISLKMFIPVLIQNTETQVMFNGAIQNNYSIIYDSWYTERKLSIDGNELQVDIGSARHLIVPYI